MHRPLVRLRAALSASLAAALLLVAACGDSSRGPSPLAPSEAPRLEVTGTSTACMSKDAAYLAQQTASLFSDRATRLAARLTGRIGRLGSSLTLFGL